MKLRTSLSVPYAICFLLAACGGGGGGGSATSSISIVGVAATGAAISNGTVEAKCATGTGSATSAADGTYTITVTNGVQPCILRATDPITKVTLHSIVESGSTTANITPVTDLVVANTLGDDPSTGFATFNAAAQSKVTSSNITAAVTRVKAVTASFGVDADLSSVDIMKGSMTAATSEASGDSTDKKIDALMAALSAADKKIADLSAQVKALTNSANAAAITTALVGDSQYALANCPYARSGNFWVFDLVGSVPAEWNANFNTMVLKKISDNSTYAINLKRDSSNNPVTCAFTSSISGQSVEYRVSAGGVGVWTNQTNFGLTVPAQKTKTLTDSSFAGSYPGLAFVKGRSNSVRLGIPFLFDIKTDGSIDAYSCDLTRTLPNCNVSTPDSKDPMTCSAMSNGTFSCTSQSGTALTAVLYLTGSQATMLMAITNMTISNASYGGLIALTKAADMSLPTVGKTKAANAGWVTGFDSGSNVLYSQGTPAAKVESVNAATNSYVASFTGTSLTGTGYINTPGKGLGYALLSDGSKGITLGSSSGWMLEIMKGPNASYYDGWAAGVLVK